MRCSASYAIFRMLVERDSASGNCEQVSTPVLHAITACLHIHYLQMPHIRSAVDSEMDQIEAEMKDNNAVVEKSLDTLAGLTDERGQALVKDARKAYADFLQVTKEIISPLPAEHQCQIVGTLAWQEAHRHG